MLFQIYNYLNLYLNEKTMNKVTNYRQIICQFLQDFAKGDRQTELILDTKGDRNKLKLIYF